MGAKSLWFGALPVLALVVGQVWHANADCTVDHASMKCFTDFTPPPPGQPRVRVLGDPVYSGSRLTQEYCAQLCWQKKLPLAGVEGSDCMCGTKVLPPAAPKPSGCTYDHPPDPPLYIS